jgi:hypothetical protein
MSKSHLTRLAQILLAALFAGCGIWLAAYSLGYLHMGRNSLPPPVAWAYNIPVARVFYLLTPGVFLPVHASELAETTRAFATVGCMTATFYLVTAALLLLKSNSGIAMAFGASLGSTAVLAYETLSALHRMSIWRFAIWRVVPLVGYACLTFVIWRAQRRTAHP